LIERHLFVSGMRARGAWGNAGYTLRAGARRAALLLVLTPRIIVVIMQKPGKGTLQGSPAFALDAARILKQRMLQLHRNRVPIEDHGDTQAPQYSLFVTLRCLPAFDLWSGSRLIADNDLSGIRGQPIEIIREQAVALVQIAIFGGLGR
jgi:hypothetical protein